MTFVLAPFSRSWPKSPRRKRFISRRNSADASLVRIAIGALQGRSWNLSPAVIPTRSVRNGLPTTLVFPIPPSRKLMLANCLM